MIIKKRGALIEQRKPGERNLNLSVKSMKLNYFSTIDR